MFDFEDISALMNLTVGRRQSMTESKKKRKKGDVNKVYFNFSDKVIITDNETNALSLDWILVNEFGN